jgi:hypothetical protein
MSLAGLFHPAATCRISLQGVSLSASRTSSSPAKCPRDVCVNHLPPLNHRV